MDQHTYEELVNKLEEKYKKLYDSISINQKVKLISDSYADSGLIYGETGIVINKGYGRDGCDIRVRFAHGYETWIDAEDFILL